MKSFETNWRKWIASLIPKLRPHWRWVLGIACFAILIGFSWLNYSDQYEEALADGRDYLNIGHYQEAKQAFQKAIDLHPLHRIAALSKVFGGEAGEAAQRTLDLLDLSSAARVGLEKASAFDPGNAELIEHKLRQLEKKYPRDADIQTLLGKFHASQNELDKATKYYKAAIQQDAGAAEAYFGLGVIDDLQGNINGAVAMFEKTVEISGSSPRYGINLAYQYAEQKRYDEALRLYGRFDQDFPIAALESAHIYRFKGELKKALDLQKIALGLLESADIMGKPENQEPWYYKTERDRITLSKPVDKKCYLYYTLAATLYLDGQKADAEKYFGKARESSDAHQVEIKDLVDFDLKRLAAARPELGQQVDAYRREVR